MKDPFRVEGKVTVVTGGGTGIGASIAREFAARGAPVLVAGRTVETLQRTRDAIHAAGGVCEITRCDVRDAAACEAMIATAVRQFGRVDVVVNNAGAVIRSPIVDMSIEQWRDVFATNIEGVFSASKTAARQFIAQGSGGSIINISSSASFSGYPEIAAYAAAKAAMNNFTMSSAMEWASAGIRVNCIASGAILIEKVSGATDYIEKMSRSRPMRRMGRVEEIAYACIFLASDAASYITGVTLPVDGGPPSRAD
jgi:meso-butanediol dehydrogenase / (S,S)-butanediol dehydrogenase / diacetyl reductase